MKKSKIESKEVEKESKQKPDQWELEVSVEAASSLHLPMARCLVTELVHKNLSGSQGKSFHKSSECSSIR